MSREEVEEYFSEDLGFRLSSGKLGVQLFDAGVDFDTPQASQSPLQLLHVGHAKSIFVASNNRQIGVGKLSDLSKDETMIKQNFTAIPLENVTYVRFDATNENLYAIADGHAYKACVTELLNGSSSPFTQLNLGGSVIALEPSPSCTETYCYMKSDKILHIIQGESKTQVPEVNGFAWCFSGTDIVSVTDTTIKFITTSGKESDSYVVVDGGKLFSVFAIDENNFYVVGKPEEDADDDVHTLVTRDNENFTSQALNIPPAYGEVTRAPAIYSSSIVDWTKGASLAFVSSGLATEITTIECGSNTRIVSQSNDTDRAELPMDDDANEDTFPVGFGLDFSGPDRVIKNPTPLIEEAVGLPGLLCLNNRGSLLVWNIFDAKGVRDNSLNLRRSIAKLAKPSKQAGLITSNDFAKSLDTNVSNLSTMAGFGTNLAPSASVPASVPAFQQQHPVPSGFGATSFGTVKPGKSMFGADDFKTESSASKPAFGSTGSEQSSSSQPATFGASAPTPAFPQQNPVSSGFGATSFGTVKPGKSMFGADDFKTGSSASKPAFGSTGSEQSSSSQPATFGASAPTPAFPQQNPVSSGFGATSFGTVKPGKSMFGADDFKTGSSASKPAFGSTGSEQSSSPQPATFGASAPTPAFPQQNPVSSGFGATSFGTVKPGKSMFGADDFKTGSSASKPAFGSTGSEQSSSSQPPASFGASDFGSNTVFGQASFDNKKPDSPFGSVPSSSGQAQGSYSGFGANSKFGSAVQGGRSQTNTSPFATLGQENNASSPFASLTKSEKASPFGNLSSSIDSKESPSVLSGSKIDENTSPLASSNQTETYSPFGNCKQDNNESPFGNMNQDNKASPFGSTNKDDKASPFGSLKQDVKASPFGSLKMGDKASPFGTLDQKEASFLFGGSKADDKSSPLGNAKQDDKASPFGTLKQDVKASPFGTLKQDVKASPFGTLKQDVKASPFGTLEQKETSSPFGSSKADDKSSPLGNAKQDNKASPFGSSKQDVKASPFGSLKMGDKASPFGFLDQKEASFLFGGSKADDKSSPLGNAKQDDKASPFGTLKQDNKESPFGTSEQDTKASSFGTSQQDERVSPSGTSEQDEKLSLFGTTKQDDKESPFSTSKQDEKASPFGNSKLDEIMTPISSLQKDNKPSTIKDVNSQNASSIFGGSQSKKTLTEGSKDIESGLKPESEMKPQNSSSSGDLLSGSKNDIPAKSASSNIILNKASSQSETEKKSIADLTSSFGSKSLFSKEDLATPPVKPQVEQQSTEILNGISKCDSSLSVKTPNSVKVGIANITKDLGEAIIKNRSDALKSKKQLLPVESKGQSEDEDLGEIIKNTELLKFGDFSVTPESSRDEVTDIFLQLVQEAQAHMDVLSLNAEKARSMIETAGRHRRTLQAEDLKSKASWALGDLDNLYYIANEPRGPLDDLLMSVKLQHSKLAELLKQVSESEAKKLDLEKVVTQLALYKQSLDSSKLVKRPLDVRAEMLRHQLRKKLANVELLQDEISSKFFPLGVQLDLGYSNVVRVQKLEKVVREVALKSRDLARRVKKLEIEVSEYLETVPIDDGGVEDEPLFQLAICPANSRSTSRFELAQKYVNEGEPRKIRPVVI